MSRFIFDLAKESDDYALRHIIEETPPDGDIRIIFKKEPSYFHAVGTEGRFNQTLVIRDTERDSIVAIGSRSVKPVYLNGQLQDIGYLSSLRIKQAYRSATLLSRGYKFLKELHQDKKAPFYITTVINDNLSSLKILTSRRADMPSYLDRGLYYTAVISPCRKKEDLNDGIEIVNGSSLCLDGIVGCLNKYGSEKQFFPFYTKGDFIANDGILRDFKIEDFCVAFKKNKIVGVMAVWNQNKFKQLVVAGYSKKIRLLRPIYNMYAKVAGLPNLPLLGRFFNAIYVSFVAVASNDPTIFRALLRRVYNENIGNKHTNIIVGLHSRDPLWKAVQEYRHLEYKSRLFIVCWEDGEGFFNSLDNRVPYLEIGTL